MDLEKKKNLLTILGHALPVSGVCQLEEQQVKETGKLSLQSLTDVALNWLPGALSWRLALHTVQQIKKRPCLLDETHMDNSNILFGLLLRQGSRVHQLLHKEKLKRHIPDSKYEDKVERIFAQTPYFSFYPSLPASPRSTEHEIPQLENVTGYCWLQRSQRRTRAVHPFRLFKLSASAARRGVAVYAWINEKTKVKFLEGASSFHSHLLKSHLEILLKS